MQHSIGHHIALCWHMPPHICPLGVSRCTHRFSRLPCLGAMDFNVIAVISANEKCFVEVLHLCKPLACDLPISAQAVNAPCGSLLIVFDSKSCACCSTPSRQSPAKLSGGRAPGRLDVPDPTSGKTYWMISETAHVACACWYSGCV